MVEEIPTASPSPSKNFVIIISIFSVVSAILLFSAIYFFFANQSSQKLLEKSKAQNSQLEKDLIFYKSTDLAKELEIVNLKLKDSEEKHEETKTKLSTTEANLNKLRQDLSSIPKITNTLSMMMTTFGRQAPDCYSASDKTNIQQELTAIGDSTLNNLWNDFINGTTSANCSFSPNLLEKVINYGLSKISGITPK